MATIKASHVPIVPQSDQYLEFLVQDDSAGNIDKRYTIGVYDRQLDKFLLREPFVGRPKKEIISTNVTFSDISLLDPGEYEAFLFEGEVALLGLGANGLIEYTLVSPTAGGPIVLDGSNLPSGIVFTIGAKAVQPTIVRLDRTNIDDTKDESLWDRILETNVQFNDYKEVMDTVLFFNDPEKSNNDIVNKLKKKLRNRLPFVGVEEYSLLKFVTHEYMRKSLRIKDAQGYFGGMFGNLPYFEEVTDDVDEIITLIKGEKGDEDGKTLSEKRLSSFPAIELIWSYWMEQGMLAQSINAISLRFQNIKGIREVEPLGRFDTSPLRSLSHIFWGYIQDEQHTVSLSRRVNEYDHEYGLKLLGRAVPQMRPVDTRSKFLEAFHTLLNKCAIFYKEIDDTTRKPDGFPIYTSLKEVHLLLAEGNHNAYQNLTWTVRQEMLVQQYILARSEMREFLGGRPMMPYQERWMDKVDTMKMLQGWDQTSIIHYYDLAYAGEKILLGIRYGNWNNIGTGSNSASNWAVAFRNLVQKYIHAYQTVTGVDFSADAQHMRPEGRALQPALLIAERTQQNKQTIEIQQRVPMRRY